MTPYLLWKGSHIHISRVIFVINMTFMNVFVCPYSFVNITVIPVHFYSFIFCFKFYFSIVDIILNHLYLYYFSARIKPIQNAVTKRKKPTVLARSVARNIVVSKKCFFLIFAWALQIYSIVFTRFLYKIYLNRWRREELK